MNRGRHMPESIPRPPLSDSEIEDALAKVHEIAEKTQEAVSRIEGQQNIILAACLEMSGRIARLEGPPNGVDRDHTPPPSRPRTASQSDAMRTPHQSITSQTLRALTEETQAQTPLIEIAAQQAAQAASAVNRLDSMAPLLSRSNRRQWITLAIVIVQSLAAVTIAIVYAVISALKGGSPQLPPPH